LFFSGILEDSTFKVPFVSHRISYPLLRNWYMETLRKKEGDGTRSLEKKEQNTIYI
jgi:hypothetical protein